MAHLDIFAERKIQEENETFVAEQRVRACTTRLALAGCSLVEHMLDADVDDE